MVPDALLVDGSAAALHAGHRLSFRSATQLVRQLSDPQPRDHRVTAQLDRYKQLNERWHDWSAVTAVLGEIARSMVEVDP